MNTKPPGRLIDYIEQASLLRDLFAYTIGSYYYLEETAVGNPDKQILLIDKSTGFLLKKARQNDILVKLHKVQWIFVRTILTEWKSLVEGFLREMVEVMLAKKGPIDQKNVKTMFRRSQDWKDNIHTNVGIDICSNTRMKWAIIREYLEIRNSLVHRGDFVDQEFLNRLQDVRADLKICYNIGDSFNINPGEIYKLLENTVEFIKKNTDKCK